MKKTALLLLALSLVQLSACKTTLTLNQALERKDAIDASENPAEKMILKNKLSDSMIVLENILVKDIIQSNNIDYDFCVVADINTDRGPIECFIYSRNINTIAKLQKGVSRISVQGSFGRFFTMLDSYYTKLEVLNAAIKLYVEPAQKAPAK